MLTLPENRWSAFGIHLVISLVLFVVLSAVIYFLWYPGFLFQTEGGWQGIRLIAGVDLVVGPLLTLIVYRKVKKGIKFDLGLICLAQMLCLAAGMVTVWYTKPVVLAYADGQFYTGNRVHFNEAGIDLDDIEFLKQKRQPVWVNIELPEDIQDRAQVMATWSFFRPISLAYELYQPYDRALPLLESEGLTLDQARREWNIEIKHFDRNVRFFKVQTRFQFRYVAIDTVTGRVVQLLEKKHW